MPSFVDEWLERVHRVPCDRDEIETFRPDLNQAATDARQVEEFVHESQECLRLGIDRLEQFDGCGILVALPQQVDRVCDRRQRVSQLMPQHGDELILPLAAGDEPRRHVRASGDVLDRQQQLFGPVSIAGDPPRAQRHRPGAAVEEGRRVTSQSSSGWASVRSARNLWCRSGMFHLAIAHFVKESAFNLFTRDLQVRRECRIHPQYAQRSIEHRQAARGRTG